MPRQSQCTAVHWFQTCSSVCVSEARPLETCPPRPGGPTQSCGLVRTSPAAPQGGPGCCLQNPRGLAAEMHWIGPRSVSGMQPGSHPVPAGLAPAPQFPRVKPRVPSLALPSPGPPPPPRPQGPPVLRQATGSRPPECPSPPPVPRSVSWSLARCPDSRGDVGVGPTRGLRPRTCTPRDSLLLQAHSSGPARAGGACPLRGLPGPTGHLRTAQEPSAG